jgi:methionyl-tRNA formyltransferase
MRVLFWGTPAFAVPTLRALAEEGHEVVAVVTRPDRPAGRGRRPRACPVKSEARIEGIPVLEPDRPEGPDFEERLRALAPDLSVVVAYGHILGPEILALPAGGSLNVHASLLPELRGAAPVHWAIARGCEQTGVTVMRMVAEMDAGPVLLRIEEPIGPQETSTELGARLSEIGAAALIEVLARLEFGEIEEEEQDHAAATFAPKVDRGSARVDWRRPAREVHDHVRAMDAVPGAWSETGGEAVKLFQPRCEVRDHVHGGGASAGEVLDADASSGRGLGVACGEGAVWFGQVQPSGRRRMDVEDWLRGRSVEVGARFR